MDVFVWVEGEDGAGAAMAVRALRQKMKAEVGTWFLLGSKSERSERLSYDLGAKPLVRPDSLAGLPALARAHGTAPLVLFWSGAAVLAAEWVPWQGGEARLWESCPAALWSREGLANVSAPTWAEFQAASDLKRHVLPSNQTKLVGAGAFEKTIQGAGWPFGPSVVILEASTVRR